MTERTRSWAVGMGVQLGQAVNPTVGVERSFGQRGRPQLRIGVQGGIPVPQPEGGGGSVMGRPSHLSVPTRDNGTGDASATAAPSTAMTTYVRGDARLQLTAAIPVGKGLNVLAGVFGGVAYAWNSSGSDCSGGYGCGRHALRRDSGGDIPTVVGNSRTTGAGELVGGLVGLEAELPRDFSLVIGGGVTFSSLPQNAVWPELGIRLNARF